LSLSKGLIKYDYTNNLVTIFGTKYNLDLLRDWIKVAYRPLTEKNKVKSIRRGSTFVPYYDWDSILNHARSELIVLEWYAHLHDNIGRTKT
jgi:hypothetical protein